MSSQRPHFLACSIVGLAAIVGMVALMTSIRLGYVGVDQALDRLVSGLILMFGAMGWAIGGWAAYRLDLDLVDLARLTQAVDKPLEDIHQQRAASVSGKRVGLLIAEACRPGSRLQILANRVLASETDFRRVSNSDLGRWVDETLAVEGNHLIFFQRVVLNLGILGTFCGLIQALWVMESSAAKSTPAILAKGLFTGLHVAFGTSIAGLIVSVSLGLVLLVLNSLRSRYSLKAELCLERLAALCQHLEVSAAHVSAYSDLRQKLSDLNQQISSQASQVDQQIQTVSTGLATLRSLGDQFTRFCESLHGSQKEALADARRMFEGFSMEQVAAAMDTRIAAAARNTTESIETQLKLHRAALEASRKSLEKDGQQQARMLQEQAQQLSASTVALAEAHNKIAGVTADLSRQLESVRKAQIEGFFPSLESKIAAMTKSTIELNGLMRDEIVNRKKTFIRKIFS